MSEREREKEGEKQTDRLSEFREKARHSGR